MVKKAKSFKRSLWTPPNRPNTIIINLSNSRSALQKSCLKTLHNSYIIEQFYSMISYINKEFVIRTWTILRYGQNTSPKFHFINYSYGVDSKIQQTKMLVKCQRFGDLFLFGLVWQYSTNQNQYNKGRFKVMATYLQQ